MTARTPNEDAEEIVSDFPGNDPQSKRRRSRRRAWRDGLAGQSVVRNFENVRTYRAFERVLIGSIDPRSVIELELAHRLASLLWRLRRASAVETGLLEIQGGLLLARRQTPPRSRSQPGPLPISTRLNGHGKVALSNESHELPASDQEPLSLFSRPPLEPCSSRAIAECFLRLSNLDPTLLDRAGRYEGRLWRQAAQTLWMLDLMRRPQPAPMRRGIRKSLMRLDRHAER
jgi:hypothetical protein